VVGLKGAFSDISELEELLEATDYNKISSENTG
jgi:hypothetical protein